MITSVPLWYFVPLWLIRFAATLTTETLRNHGDTEDCFLRIHKLKFELLTR
jgi:hypothetical protein